MCWGLPVSVAALPGNYTQFSAEFLPKLLSRTSEGCGAVALDVDGVGCTGNFSDSCEQGMDVLGDNERISAALTGGDTREVAGDKNGFKLSFCARMSFLQALRKKCAELGFGFSHGPEALIVQEKRI